MKCTGNASSSAETGVIRTRFTVRKTEAFFLRSSGTKRPALEYLPGRFQNLIM
jgi:hypothetical protein